MKVQWMALIISCVIGCAGASPQVDNVGKVARNVSKGLPEQSRLLMCLVGSQTTCSGMPGASDRDVVRAHVRDNATLSCEIATRDDAATAAVSPACQCAKATSAEDFETACGTWAGVK